MKKNDTVPPPLIQLRDGAILDIREDSYKTAGCDTCYGGTYVSELSITTSNGYRQYESKSDDALSHGFLIRLFVGELDRIKTMTLAEFDDWLTRIFNRTEELDG